MFRCAWIQVAMPAVYAEGCVATLFCVFMFLPNNVNGYFVECAHDLYRRSGKTTLTFADVAEDACVLGPSWAKPYGYLARRFVEVSIFATYFGTCSAYTIIIAKNFDKVTSYYWGSLDIHLYLLIWLIPLLFVVYVPNLKYFAIISVASNILMTTGLALTCYYLINDLPSVDNRKLAGDISHFPSFFSIIIFALEAIGIVMQLENNMDRPTKFIGICGVLNKGMSVVTLLHIAIGFLGYLRFGELTESNITLNLPPHEYLAQAVQILISLAIYGTYGLPFFVCLEIVWNSIKERYQNRPRFANYCLRTALLVAQLLLAIAVPSIGPFIGLIGALCFSFLGIVLPAIIEVITFWQKGFGVYNWRIVKNIIVVSAGLFAVIFGTKASVREIIDMYYS